MATRRALEHRRRAAVLERKLPLLVPDPVGGDEAAGGVFPDDRLRLVFTCCHPALAEAQVALTLKLVYGLSSAEIAKVYSVGHTAKFGGRLSRPDLSRRGLDLARMVHLLLPDSGEATALLGLLLLTHARDAARVDDAGQLVLMRDQVRALWDGELIAEGLRLVEAALGTPPSGRFALLAAIGAVHAEARRWEDTDWEQILGLYDLLLTRWPSPVVALNRAVALSYADSPQAALDVIQTLVDEPALATYPYLAATRADLLRRTGHRQEAIAACEEAVVFTDNAIEADHLSRRLDELRNPPEDPP